MTKPLSQDEQAEVWDEIISHYKYQFEQLPNEKTRQEFADEIGVSLRTASKILSDFVELGKMQKRIVKTKTGQIAVYWPVSRIDAP